MEGHFSHWIFYGLIKRIPTGHSTLEGIGISEGGCCDAEAFHLWQSQKSGFDMLP